MADDQRPSASTIPTAVGPARFTPEEFGLLIESGVAAKLGRIELRGGEIYRMNAQYALHARMRMKLSQSLEAALANLQPGLSVIDEVTVQFGKFLPLPDIVVFGGAIPRGAIAGENVRLIVEVADSSLTDDLGPKRDLYAAAGLPEYWIVDMVSGAILLYADPADGSFSKSRTVARGAVAESLTLADISIDTAKLPWTVS